MLRTGHDPPRPLMLGKGWFPDTVGGLDRYYRDLFESLPEASGVVLGPAKAAPSRVAVVSNQDGRLAGRLLAVWRAAQRLGQNVDLVDGHFALYALLPLYVGRLSRIPAIIHFQGPWADECAMAGSTSRLAHAARRAIERAVLRRAEAVIVLTSAFRQVAVERYGVSPWRVHVIPPSVDLDRFTPGPAAPARHRLGVSDEAFIALTVRRLTPRMGLGVLVDAWAAALTELPAGSTLFIAGDGPSRADVERVIAEHGVGDSVRLLGRVSDATLVELYRAADVAVVPTLAHEGFGLVVIEAAACGTPTIVTAAGGLPAAVRDLDPSLVVPPDDAEALRRRIVRSVYDRPDRAAARAHAERFAPAELAARHRTIARTVVSGGLGRSGDGRLRVVYLDHVAQLSGGEIALVRLLPHLDRVDPHVILAEDGPLVSELHNADISTEVLPLATKAQAVRRDRVIRSGISGEVAGPTAAYVLRLAHRLRRLQPDLVHTNSLKAGVYGSLAARLAGVPVVWHVRDRIAEDYLPRPAVRLVRAMTRRLASAVVANSRSTLATLRAPRQPLVMYSVLPEVLSDVPVRERRQGGPLTYGVVGRLAPWKGQDFFLQAFARAFAESEERAVVVGGALFGEDDYAAGLGVLAERLGIGPRVELRGHRTDVWGELARLDVLVHASLTPEPFGQVILEGMAAGVPVVAAHAGGPAEILDHDVTGLLYRPRDIDGLAAAMRRLHDPALRRRLSDAARAGLGRYSPTVVAAELQDLYASVAARSVRRR